MIRVWRRGRKRLRRQTGTDVKSAAAYESGIRTLLLFGSLSKDFAEAALATCDAIEADFMDDDEPPPRNTPDATN